MVRRLVLAAALGLLLLAAGTASAQNLPPGVPPDPPDPPSIVPPQPPDPPDPPPAPDPPSDPTPPGLDPDPTPPDPPSPPGAPETPDAPSLPPGPDPPAGPSPPEAPSPPTAPPTDPPDPPAAPSPPPTPSPDAQVGTDQGAEGDCAATGNGTTCWSRESTRRGASVGGVGHVALVVEERHVQGSHDGSDGSTPNNWRDHEHTREARAGVEAGPAPADARLSVTNGTREHRQDNGTSQGTDTHSASVAAGLQVGGPLSVDESAGWGVAYRESFAGDGHHRCEVDPQGAPAAGATCPTSLGDDDGLPPGPLP